MENEIVKNFGDFATQNGPWAAMALLIGWGAFCLIRWTLNESAKREIAVLEACDKREADSRALINQQMLVIDRQSSAVESQSNALNRITDRIESLARAIERNEQYQLVALRREGVGITGGYTNDNNTTS